MAQVIQYLLSMCEVLESIPSMCGGEGGSYYFLYEDDTY
jgi:hypothetical protein